MSFSNGIRLSGASAPHVVVALRVPPGDCKAAVLAAFGIALINLDGTDLPGIAAQANPGRKATEPSLALNSNPAFQSDFNLCKRSENIQNTAVIPGGECFVGQDAA